MRDDPMRVVFATDGSPSAAQATNLVAGVAWPEGSTIRVVEAIEAAMAVSSGPWPGPGYLQQDDRIDAQLRRGADAVVTEVRDRLERPAIDVVADVLRGRAATAIVDAAAALRADLVIIGSRGHGTIESMLLGSVSAEVVDHAPMPVLVARKRSLNRVVLGWDGSGCARGAADLLSAWPMFADSHVRVVSVADVQVPWWSGITVDTSPDLLPALVDASTALREEHDLMARAMAEDLRQSGLAADAELRAGDPATELLAAARACDADVIVLGTHGRTGVARLLLGSVARNVVHHAKCSVLIARERPAG